MEFVEKIKSWWKAKDKIDQAIWGVAIALFVVTVSFGSYYYWDRYVALGDQSPLEMGITELEGIVRAEPENIEARLALAEHYMNTGRYLEAIQQGQQILTNYPDVDSAMLIVGTSYYFQENYEPAIGFLENFVNIRSQSGTAMYDPILEYGYYILGNSYYQNEQYTDAIRSFSQALVINQGDADAIYWLGMSYQAEGQHEAAVEEFHYAVRYVPNFIEAFQAMIVSYTGLEMPGMVAYARGMELLWTNELQSAVTHLESAIEHEPDFASIYTGLCLTHERLAEFETAISYCQQAIELDPNDFTAQNALGRIEASN